MDDKRLTGDDICNNLNASNETAYKRIDGWVMSGYRPGRRWMFKPDEGDKGGRFGGAADKSDKPDPSRRATGIS